MMENKGLKYAKRLSLMILTAVVLGAGAFSTEVSAQKGTSFEIQVPFDFVVRGRTFAAARYRIGRLSPANPDVLVLKNSAGRTLMILQTQRLGSGAPAELSRLTFSRYGETNFLDSIMASGESYASLIPPVRSDRERRETAQTMQIVSLTHK